MPIQKTKFTMSNAQATGIWLPHTPMPFQNSQPMAPRNTVSMPSDTANAMYQARGGRSASAMRDTLSVMRAKALSPVGAETNGFRSVAAAMSAELRVRVTDAAHIADARMVVELAEQ